MRVRLLIVCAVVLIAILIGILAACSGSSPSTGASSGLVNVSVSDPTTCSAPSGPYSHVYVTITDVRVNTNANAGDNDSSWVDLTSALKNAPAQVDLLGLANSSCFLADLGDKLELQPGNYQQIRVILAPDNASSSVSGNKCGNASNCVVLAADSSVHALALSSEATTGIKIPSGQIAGGQFTIAAGQTKDLNIDFNACASIVIQGNGQYRLKPVLHAGEVATASASINGKVFDAATNAAVSGGAVVVALEQQDSTGVDRVVMQTLADSTGAFVFCPVPAGSYDVVIAAINGTGTAYVPKITTGVQPGSALGTITVAAVTGTNTSPASITGTVSTVNASNAGTPADVSVSALEQIAGAGTYYTIPLAGLSSATATLTTATNASCPANTDCATYTAQLSPVAPALGTFSAGGTTYSGGTNTASYVIDALAFIPQSGGTPDCSPSEQKTVPYSVTAAGLITAQTLAFTGCQ
jgi:Domain of unknown function (DUF4382)